MYFRRCVSNDKLEGVGHLVNYCEHYDVNVSKWQLEKFRSALNYYLNEKFDLNKICLFNKFYTAFFQSRYRDATQKKLPTDQLAKAVFGENDDLVDMKGLLQYVVEHM